MSNTRKCFDCNLVGNAELQELTDMRWRPYAEWLESVDWLGLRHKIGDSRYIADTWTCRYCQVKARRTVIMLIRLLDKLGVIDDNFVQKHYRNMFNR